ncbi:MAG: hypothetical protein ABJZ55_06005 [Fuerstiella sp.]
MTVSFPQLLDAAESRMQTDGSCTDLIQSLCKQLAFETDAEAVALVAWDGSNRIPVLQLGPQLKDEYSVDAVPPGRVLHKKILHDKLLLQAAAQVSGGMTIVLMSVYASDVNADELLTAVIEVIADLYRRRLLEAASSKDAAHRDQLNLLSCLHQSLDSNVVANTIATDGVVLTAARTISVAHRLGKRWTVVAATGVSHPNDRSDAIRNTLVAIKEAGQDTADAQDTGKSPAVVVRPLNVPSDFQSARWVAVFDLPDDAGSKQAINRVGVDLLCHHGALALANCERYASSSVSNQIKHFGRRLIRPGSLLSIIVAAALIACLFLLKTELRIEAYGELVPVDRVFMFAPEDGTIEKVNFDDGSDVTTSDALCVLSNEDLQVQLEGLEGRLSESTARLAAIAALKGRPNADSEARLLSAEQLELEARAKSLTQQIQIMERRMAALILTTSKNGRIYGDRLEELLTNRPVQRGQFLFEVANPNGEWQLELKVPELDIRHVLHVVQKDDADRPKVRYALETSPETTHEAILTSIAGSTEVQSDGRLTTLVVVDVGAEQYSTERPGTGVVAYIDCGRYRVGYVWFRKMIEFVQRNAWR